MNKSMSNIFQFGQKRSFSLWSWKNFCLVKIKSKLTPPNIKRPKRSIKERSNLESLIGVLNKTSLKFSLNSGEDGKLFGSVTSSMITEEIINNGYSLDKKDIIIEEPIKTIGNHFVNIRLSADINAKIKIKVSAEK